LILISGAALIFGGKVVEAVWEVKKNLFPRPQMGLGVRLKAAGLSRRSGGRKGYPNNIAFFLALRQSYFYAVMALLTLRNHRPKHLGRKRLADGAGGGGEADFYKKEPGFPGTMVFRQLKFLAG